MLKAQWKFPKLVGPYYWGSSFFCTKMIFLNFGARIKWDDKNAKNIYTMRIDFCLYVENVNQRYTVKSYVAPFKYR